MIEEIERLKAQVLAATLSNREEAEAFNRQFTSKKGSIQSLFDAFKQVPPEDRRVIGQAINELKKLAEGRLAEALEQFAPKVSATAPNDLTKPGSPTYRGSRHPLTLVTERVVSIFQRVGFSIDEGPEIETDWYNFSALNFEENHPARDMQDTFFIRRDDTDSRNDLLLRTHTSNVQVRAMERMKPPIRIVMPGRVYRNEAISARAHCFFHQIEGLVVDEGVSFADLKLMLQYFVDNLFGGSIPVRLRPSYFPFTEISAEMDIECQVCGGSGCTICKHSGWVEILGCGMVDPAVLENCGIDSERYTGYAFGMGVERIAQLLYRVPDLRLYSQNDLRFLRQFEAYH
jgi:phenylalanyl-tRNA synthetase alpha chain